MRERLWSAYLDSLSNLQAKWFPHADAQDQFTAIRDRLSIYGEAIEGAGSVPTTLWMMNDAEAADIAERALDLADRYRA